MKISHIQVLCFAFSRQCLLRVPAVSVLSICIQSVATTLIISPDNIKKKRDGRKGHKQGELGDEKDNKKEEEDMVCKRNR